MLAGVKVVIPSTQGEQFNVAAAFHNSAFLNHQNLVSTPDC
jgi:hypothetical protein